MGNIEILCLEQRGIALDELWHGGGGDAGVGVVVEVVEVDVVHALGDVRDPGELLLLGGGRQVDHTSLPGLPVL